MVERAEEYEKICFPYSNISVCSNSYLYKCNTLNRKKNENCFEDVLINNEKYKTYENFNLNKMYL